MGKLEEAFRKAWQKNTELETENDFKKRWISVFVIYCTIFLMTLGFAITLTGVWPYLDKVKFDMTFCFYIRIFFVLNRSLLLSTSTKF